MTIQQQVAPEVAEALRFGRPVVALETTLVAHGFSDGQGLRAALAAEERVLAAGATPATIGVADGTVLAGMSRPALERFAAAGPAARKVGARDLAPCIVQGALGATTVGGTLAICRMLGIRFLGTGGIGGVHRGYADNLDISGDLLQIARTQAVVVSSGVKSILDVPATAELLETLGVPVLGFRTDDPRSCGILELDDRCTVVGFHEKVDHPPGNLANAAVYVFEPAVIDAIAGIGRPAVDLSTEIIPDFVGRILCVETNGYHRDIGTLESLRRARAEFGQRPRDRSAVGEGLI